MGESKWFFIEKSLTFRSIYTYTDMPYSTPFFAAFGSLHCGRAPRGRLQDLLGQWPQRPLNQYMAAYEFIPQTLLARSKEKVNSRQRIFSPLVTFGPFLARVLTPLSGRFAKSERLVASAFSRSKLAFG